MSLAKLELRLDAASWRRVPRLKGHLEKVAEATMARVPARYQMPVEINLLLTANAAMRRLNLDFRGVDKPTNVLSFPEFDPAELPKKGKFDGPLPVGDIVMAYQYVVAEAKNDHKLLINHISHLLIHGILHLFGYDHGSTSDAERMEGLERKIMADLKLPDPYVFRTPAPRKK